MFSELNTLQARVIAWGTSCPDLRAMLMVGSQAGQMRPADEWSDLDLMLFMDNIEPYLENQDWIRALGPVLILIPYETAEGDPEFLVLFEGEEKVDFVFYKRDELQELVQTQQLPPVYHPGYRILEDKDGLTVQLPPSPEKLAPSAQPTQQVFVKEVETCWYGALYVAKQIRRGNLWAVKNRDWSMKEHLLNMLV